METNVPGLAAHLRSMLKIGTIGFGGGSALIPVMHRELVVDRAVLDDRTFTQHVVVDNITPGALPVKLAGLSGLHLGGRRWVAPAALAVAAPGTVATVALLAAFSWFGPAMVRGVELASVGISAFIIALLAHYVAQVVWADRSRRTGAVVITALTFLVTGLPGTAQLAGEVTGAALDVRLPRLGTVQVIAVTLVLVAGWSLVRRDRRPTAGAGPAPQSGPAPGTARAEFRDAAAAAGGLAVLGATAMGAAALAGGREAAVVAGLVALSAITSFGGGEAYVAVADGFFVAGGHVTSEAFYGQMVPVANALPGPILVKLAAAVGWQAGDGGLLASAVVALACGVVAVAVCTALAVLIMGGYATAERSVVVQALGTYILPVIAGLLVTTTVSMLHAAARIGSANGVSSAGVVGATLLAVIAMSWARQRHGVHDMVLLAAASAVSWGVLNLLAGR